MKKTLICLVVCILLISLFVPKISANTNYNSKLHDINVSFEDVYLQDKVKIKISFKTKESLSHLKVISTLANGQEEVSFELGRENEGTLTRIIPENEGDMWEYYLEFNIEYIQIGTLQIVFEYSFDLLKEEVYVNTFYVPGENWVEKDQISVAVAIVGGITTFGLSVLGTYIIVSFSKTKVFYVEKDYKDEEDEE